VQNTVTPKITYLGHAGFMVETKHELILMDPWLSPTGAFDGSWQQFPDNHQLISMVRDNVVDNNRRVYIYVSHEHQDHFDPWTLNVLQQARKDITLIVPQFRREFLERWALDNWKSDQIITVCDNARVLLKGGYMCFFLDDTVRESDSAVLLSIQSGEDSFRFFNLNDCHLNDRVADIARLHGHIDVLAAAFSGASWFPVCYSMSTQEMSKKTEETTKTRFNNLIKVLEDIKPDYYVPSAGPAVLVESDTARMYMDVRKQAFPDATVFHAALMSHFVFNNKHPKLPFAFDYHLPGNQLMTTPDPVEQIKHKNIATVTSVGPTNIAIEDVDVGDLIALLKDKMDNFKLSHMIDTHLVFNLASINQVATLVHVDFKNRDVCCVQNLPQEVHDNHYYIRVEWNKIWALLKRKLTWYEWMLTMRAQLKRVPNIFNPLLDGFIVCEPEDLPAFCDLFEERAKANQETIQVEHNGTKYYINRYCPHAGADLKNARIENGVVVCPKHGWRFDLKHGGQCQTHKCTIEAKEV
jgi:UDP-MurNAc hydroxylase